MGVVDDWQGVTQAGLTCARTERVSAGGFVGNPSARRGLVHYQAETKSTLH